MRMTLRMLTIVLAICVRCAISSLKQFCLSSLNSELPARSFWRAFSCLMSPQAMIFNHSAQSPVSPS